MAVGNSRRETQERRDTSFGSADFMSSIAAFLRQLIGQRARLSTPSRKPPLFPPTDHLTTLDPCSDAQ